jgi:hypothetical protein
MPSPLAGVRGIEVSSFTTGVSADVSSDERLRHLSTFVLVLATVSGRLCPQPSRTNRSVLDERSDSADASDPLPGRAGDQIGRASFGSFIVSGAGWAWLQASVGTMKRLLQNSPAATHQRQDADPIRPSRRLARAASSRRFPVQIRHCSLVLPA